MTGWRTVEVADAAEANRVLTDVMGEVGMGTWVRWEYDGSHVRWCPADEDPTDG